MAWTSPMTFTANSVLTASQLNTHLRDNMIELAPAKASQAGALFTSDAPNRIEQRIPKTARVSTTQSLAKTEYRDLATVGPKVTVTTGKNAMVFLAAAAGSFANDQSSYMSYQITGQTNKDPSDNSALLMEGANATKDNRWCQMIVEQDLDPGVNTFTAKYKAGSEESTSTWHNRFILVWPF